jgi:hypothetical protein
MLAFNDGNHNFKIFSQSAWFNWRMAGRQQKQRRAGVPSYLIRPKSNKTSQIHGQPKK